jgi:hypothetical protein
MVQQTLKRLTNEKRSLLFKLLGSSVKNKSHAREAYKIKCKELYNETFKTMILFEKDLASKAKNNHKLLYSYVNNQKQS